MPFEFRLSFLWFSSDTRQGAATATVENLSWIRWNAPGIPALPSQAPHERHTLIKSRDIAPALRTRIIVGKHTENDSLLGAVGLVLRHQTKELSLG